jgi:predicted permease
MFANDLMTHFFMSQALIWGPLITGHHLRQRGWIPDHASKPIFSFNLIFTIPIVNTLGVWGLDRSGANWYFPPIVLGLLLGFSTLVAAVACPRMAADRATVGTLSIMVPLGNMGHTLAGFLTLLLLGEKAYPFNAILMWPVLLFSFMVWLPLARHWGHGAGQSLLTSYRQALWSPFSVTLIGLSLGTALNLSGVPMGPGWHLLLKIMIFMGTILVMFALGSRLRMRRIGQYHSHLKWIYLAKFGLHPAFVVALILAMGLHGLPAAALLISSCMPVGVSVVAFSTIYDLEVDLANAGYLWSTLIFMFLILPLLILALQLPMFQPQ